MNLDELKGGLSTLAAELEPFEGNVRALHRHERRRRIVLSTVAAAVVVVIGLATAGVAHDRASDKVHIAGVPSKEVPADRMTHIDVIVVPASPAVKAVLDGSPLVGQYARIPAHRSAKPNLLVSDPERIALCALQTTDGYAVDAATPGADIRTVLGRALFAVHPATMYPTEQLSVDAEVFMEVKASTQQSTAVRTALTLDPAIRSVRYLDRSDAYAIYKKDFASQSALVESTRPSDLPESFRIFVKPGLSVEEVVRRYKSLAGVDTVITPATSGIFDPTAGPATSANPSSPCARP